MGLLLNKLPSKLKQSKPKILAAWGYSLVELLVALGLFSMMIPVLFAGFIATRDGKPQQKNRVRAAALMKETTEALRVIREQGWPEFAVDGTYHPVIDQVNGTWTLAPGSETIDSFTRQLTIEPVMRNDLGEIIESGGTLDPSTKKVTVEISWDQPLISSLTSSLYMTRYLDNLSLIHTTVADFEQTGHVVDNIEIILDPTVEEPDNAYIQLSPFGTGRGNWCEPDPNFVQFDLSGQAEASGIMAFYNSAENRTEVFTSTGKNASGKPLSYVRVSDDYPPVPTLAGELETSPQIRANSVFGVPGYAYLTTSSPGEEIIIVDLNDMSKVGYYDASGSVDGGDVFVKDGVGYLVQGSNLRLFDASSPLGSRSTLGSVGLAGDGSKVLVVGQFAYVAINSSSSQLQIIDVSDSSAPSLVKSYTVNGGGGKSLFVNDSGERVYLVTTKSSTQDEFFIVDVSDPAKQNLQTISSADTGEMDPNAIGTVLEGNRMIVVGEGGNEYQVWSVVNQEAPRLCGSLGSLGGVNDLATVVQDNGDAYAYITTGQADSELKIIEGGPGNTYQLYGSYESAPFDAQQATAFNRLLAESDITATTNVKFQAAIASPADNNCSNENYFFVGPDGTADSYFEDLGALPFDSNTDYENPGQCFKYKIYLETDNIEETPFVHSILVNYSP